MPPPVAAWPAASTSPDSLCWQRHGAARGARRLRARLGAKRVRVSFGRLLVGVGRLLLESRSVELRHRRLAGKGSVRVCGARPRFGVRSFGSVPARPGAQDSRTRCFRSVGAGPLALRTRGRGKTVRQASGTGDTNRGGLHARLWLAEKAVASQVETHVVGRLH
jgi:hypothetical protein